MFKKLLLITSVAFLFLKQDLYADRRYFARSYMANTLPAGALELELWNTGRIGKDAGFYYRFQPRFEIELGVTDRFTSSFYLNLSQTSASGNGFSSSPLSLSSTALEFRYRFTDPGQTFVDPALYFEFAYGGEEIEYEGKIILSRRFENFLAAVNINGEIERVVPESELESSFELTGGLMYEFISSFAAGIEIRSHHNFEKIYEEQENKALFIGPTVNIQKGNLYFTFNLLKQISGDPDVKDGLDLLGHENYEFRTILGVEL